MPAFSNGVRFARRIVLSAISVAIVSVAGCGPTDTSCPVSGTVTVNGKPTGGVYVALHATPAGGTPVPGAGGRSNDDGTFSFRTAAPGDYAVTAFWPAIVVDGDETNEGPDQFQGKYRDPAKPISQATIVDGENVLPPIDLKHP